MSRKTYDGAGGGKRATKPELLARFDALGLTADAFERAHDLPARFVSKARAGKLTGSRAGDSWQRFARAIEAAEKERKSTNRSTGAQRARARAAEVEAPASVPRPTGVCPTCKRLEFSKEAEAEEVALFEARLAKAVTLEGLDEIATAIMVGARRPPSHPGHIDETQARVLSGALGEKRQLAIARAKELAEARGNEPMTVIIEYVGNWRDSATPKGGAV